MICFHQILLENKWMKFVYTVAVPEFRWIWAAINKYLSSMRRETNRLQMSVTAAGSYQFEITIYLGPITTQYRSHRYNCIQLYLYGQAGTLTDDLTVPLCSYYRVCFAHRRSWQWGNLRLCNTCTLSITVCCLHRVYSNCIAEYRKQHNRFRSRAEFNIIGCDEFLYVNHRELVYSSLILTVLVKINILCQY